MKETKSSFSKVLGAFLLLVGTWLIQENFVQLVNLWKQAKAKVSGNDQPTNENASVE